MDTIGIKLADGSFYPIFEDGKPAKKTIELTTVKDNQTTVHVDVYRSNTESMSDAQYVDTLEIANLNPHTNGEPSLNLDIELDENNKLCAKIHDPETGKESEKQINLISRSEAERDEPANFSIVNQDASDTPFDFDSPAAMQENSADDSTDNMNEKTQAEPVENTLEDPLAALDALPDFKDNLDEIPEDIDETIQSLETEQEGTLPDPLAALDALPDFKDNLDDFDSNDNFEAPVITDNAEPESDTQADFVEPVVSEPEEIAADSADSLAALDELPDFKDNLDEEPSADSVQPDFAEPVVSEPEEIAADPADSLAALDELPDFKDNLDDNFDMPDNLPAQESFAQEPEQNNTVEQNISEPEASEPEEITADTAASLAALDELPDFKDNLDDTSFEDVAAENAQPQEAFEKPFDAIFNPPDEQNDEPMKPILPEKDPSFEDVLHSISGKDDNPYGDTETQKASDEEAKETLEEIPAENAIPSDAEFVDSLGGEEVSSGFADIPSSPVADTGSDFVMPEMSEEQKSDEPVTEEISQDMGFDAPEKTDDTVFFGAPADDADLSVANEFDTSAIDQNDTFDTETSTDSFDELPAEPIPPSDDAAASGDAEETFEPATIFDEPDEPISSSSSTDDFSLPNFDNLSSMSEPIIPALDTGFTSSFSSNDDFDLPDFSSSSSSSEDFVLPDIGDLDDAVKEEANVDFELPEFESTTSTSSSTMPFSSSNMFGDLYDKETLEGKSSNAFEDNGKKTKVPMFICITCAVICILCLFFLFVIPSKYNPLHKDTEIAMANNTEAIKEKDAKIAESNKDNKQDTVQPAAETPGTDSTAGLIADNSTQTKTGKKEEPVAKIDLSPKPKPVPAKEDEIVIATVPSKVVPETPVKNAKNLPDTKYTIQWGDTLWDIANAFYKNPWKYTYLAEYNHLPNPNYIKTGSVLLIPAE